MNKKKLEKIFVDIAKSNEDCESIIAELRSLESTGEISEADYDYLTKNWDKILSKYNID